jgi:hypothetical protein
MEGRVKKHGKPAKKLSLCHAHVRSRSRAAASPGLVEAITIHVRQPPPEFAHVMRWVMSHAVIGMTAQRCSE